MNRNFHFFMQTTCLAISQNPVIIFVSNQFDLILPNCIICITDSAQLILPLCIVLRYPFLVTDPSNFINAPCKYILILRGECPPKKTRFFGQHFPKSALRRPFWPAFQILRARAINLVDLKMSILVSNYF